MGEIIIPRRNRPRPAFAEFLPGEDFRTGISNTFGSSFCMDSVTSFSRAAELDNAANLFVASTQGSIPIYVWADGTDLLWYSNANTAYLNSNPSYMFENMLALRMFDFSGISTAHATTMGYFFSTCQSLETINIPSALNLRKAGTGYMFYRCESLPSFDFSALKLADNGGMEGMFYGCTALKSVKVIGDFHRTLNIQKMFYGCTALKSFDFGGAIFGEDLIASNEMFAGCTSLENVDMGASGFAYDLGDESGMFKNCTKLKHFKHHAITLTSGSERLFTEMFSGCTRLLDVDLSPITVNTGAFLFCGNSTFDGCANLTTIYAQKDFADYNNTNVFRGCTSLVGGAGTTYDANHIDGTYARIDNRPTRPGYLTYKAAS